MKAKKLQADVIFLDFSKGFVKVHHPSILEKQSKYGVAVNLLNWLRALLSNRRQRVVLGENHSDWITVMSDVLQSSVLGSMIFAVFKNELQDNLLSTCKIFADDTKLIATIRSDQSNQDQAKLQSDIDKVKKWCKKWQIVLKNKKCKVMNIGKGNNSGKYTIENEDSRKERY